MGLLRLIATAALVWFVSLVGPRVRWPAKCSTESGRHDAPRPARRQPAPASQPKDDGLGDYVDFEEVDEP